MALENIHKNGKEEPCKAYHSNVYGGSLELLGDEDAAVEQQDRQFHKGYRKGVGNDASHQKLGSSLVLRLNGRWNQEYLEGLGKLLDGKCLSM